MNLDIQTQQNTNSAVKYSGTKGRILELLGNGMSPEIVATAAGVTPGYVSQLLSDEEYSKQVVQLRFNNLQAATARDKKYEELEDALILKLQDLLPLMYKPQEVLRAIAIINKTVRRGASAPENMTINNTVVNLTLPTKIINNFKVGANNQIVEVAGKTLVTMPSQDLAKIAMEELNTNERIIDSVPQKQLESQTTSAN